MLYLDILFIQLNLRIGCDIMINGIDINDNHFASHY